MLAVDDGHAGELAGASNGDIDQVAGAGGTGGVDDIAAVPDVGVSKRLTSLRVVVLPQPDSPSKTSVSPRSTARFNSEIIGLGTVGSE